ncbi:MAG: hypothetical protein ABI837_01400 [Acidobacteriota bacterium]
MAELAQRHVGLTLQIFCKLGAIAPAVQVRPERRLGPEFMKGTRERVVGDWVRASLEEGGHECPVACHQHVKERDRADVRPMRKCQLNEGRPVQEQCLTEGVVLHLLGLLVTQKQLHEAVEPRGHGDGQRRLPDLFRNRKALAGTYPGFDFVEPSRITETDQLFGVSNRERVRH